MQNTVETTAALITCPCCGHDAELYRNHRRLYVVECSNLSTCTEWPMTHPQDTAERAITAWNNKETH